MKYILFIISFLLFCALTTFAQQLPPSVFDKFRLSLSDRTIQADILPVKHLPATNPKLNYYWYAANNIHITQGGFSGKLLNGNYQEFYLNKNLREQGTFQYGLKHGIWKNWNESGNLRSQYSWHFGLISGKFSLYNDSGQLIKQGTYRNNLLEGKIITYVTADSAITAVYKKGKVMPPDTTPSFFKRIHLFHRKGTKKDSLVAPVKP